MYFIAVLGGDAEDAHEVVRVSGVAGFAEDAVLAELGGADPEGRKKSLMTMVEMGASRSSATIAWSPQWRVDLSRHDAQS
ncbi:hypothetical protein [Streptomyces sp. NPDC003710]